MRMAPFFISIIMKHSISEIQISYRPNKYQTFPKITCSQDAYNLFHQHWDQGTLQLFEEFKVLLLNNANEVLGVFKVSQGGITATSVDLRIMFATVLKCGAVGIITAHNHPSGNLKPSRPDIQLYKKIKKICEFQDITYLDNLIITNTDFRSFTDNGLTS